MKDGHSKICKDCHNLSVRNKTLKLREDKVLKGDIKLKVCNICKIEKRLSKFNKSKKTLDGYLDGCIQCKRDIKNIEIDTKVDISKKCKECNVLKNVNNFYRCTKIKDGYFNICIDCEKIRSLEYHNLYTKKNIKKIRQSSTIIIPVSSAKTEEELLLLNHYTNLQPLCSKINRDIKKSNI